MINTKPRDNALAQPLFEEVTRFRLGGSIDPTPYAVGGANSTTMVVMFVDCCVGSYSTFRTIPTYKPYGAGVF
jgi:hypothetical protein